jgi:hypothetical protein
MNKYSLSRVVNATTNYIIERFQKISNFDTNVGAMWVSNAAAPDNSLITLPMLLIDCGSVNQMTGAGGSVVQPPVLYQPYWDSNANTANIKFLPEVGTNPDGNSTTIYSFQSETNQEQFIYGQQSCATLNWVNLRMNLYGQRKRATKFLVTVFQVTQDEVDIHEGAPGNVDKKALFQYLERPFIFSNLQQDIQLKKTGIRIIKEFTYNVDPMTSIDLNTTTGNIHEANIFIKINKRLDYQYNKSSANILGHDQADGQDYSAYVSSDATVHTHPRPKQNVYVAIRAFAPIRTTLSGRGADDSPSIDIIVRRSMTHAMG